MARRVATGDWGAGARRAVADLFAFLMLSHIVTVAATLRGDADGQIPDPHLDRLLLIVAETVLLGLFLYAGRHERRRSIHVALVVAGAVVMLTSVVAQHNAPDAATQHALSRVGMGPLACVVVYISTKVSRSLAGIAASGVLFLGIRMVVEGVDRLPHALDVWVTGMAFLVAVAVVLPPLRAAAARADQLDHQIRIDAKRVAEVTHQHRAAEESRRVVHDDVIGALRAVELELPRPGVVAAARAARAAIASGPALASSRDDLLGRIEEMPGLTVTVSGTWQDTPPPQVMTAMAGGLGEALRNVVRHAGVDRAHVTLHQSGTTHVIEIGDAGAGTATSPAGFGTAQSIVARLADVGGAAEIRTGDHGTTVQLSWTPTVEPETDPPPLISSRATYLQFGAIFLLSQISVIARQPGDSLWVSAAVWCGFAVVVLATAWHVSSEGRPSVAGLLLATGTGCALAVVGMLNQPDGSLLTAARWPIGLVLPATMLYAFAMPLRWTIVPVATAAGVVLGLAAHDPTLGPWDPVGVLITIPAFICAGAVFGELLRRGARKAVLATRKYQDQVDELAWLASYETARRHQEQLISRDVDPFLAAVIEKEAPDQPATAALLAEECRDGLYLEQPMPETARRAIRAARARGLGVVIHTSEARAKVPDVAWDLLGDILGVASEGRVTLRPISGLDVAVEIAAVPALRAPLPRATGVTEQYGATVARIAEPE